LFRLQDLDSKQLQLDAKNRKLYWSDREGMRVMRSNLDGSNIENARETGHGDADRPDARNWCVGIAIDVNRGKFYWSKKEMTTPAKGAFSAPALKSQRPDSGKPSRHRSSL